MKAIFDFIKPVRETITIPKTFEFIYGDDIGPDEYTQEQWDLWELWTHEILPQLLGPGAIDIECWEVFPDD
jgi:hypothetical protein